MTKKIKPSTYTPRPEVVNPEVLRRLEVISRVMSGSLTVTGGATELGLSRNYFQTIYHRSLGAMMEELDPDKAGGRPPKDPQVRELEESHARLTKENASLKIQLAASQQATLGLATLVREQHSIGKKRETKTKATEATSDDAADDDDGDVGNRARVALLQEHARMRAAGVDEELAAMVLDCAASTLRRWRARERAGAPLARVRGPRPTTSAHVATPAAEKLVRDVRGNIGAAALGKAVDMPRRRAAVVKARIETEIERERKENASRVQVAEPGIVRGFDQMYVATSGGWRFALISADASVPYRTSALAAERYTSDAVCAALELDYATHGAPLVERLDRAAVHRTPQVLALLEAHGVLALHGPPHHPRFYGQLERQNREHRAWLDDVEIRDESHLGDELSAMLHCWNDLIPRRSLEWCTPAQRWNQRPQLQIDRDAFRDEVRAHASKISTTLTEEERSLGYAQRFAIERTLTAHGLLRVTNEGRC